MENDILVESDKMIIGFILQDQLENKVSSGRLSVTTADQIIQQHYNQVEHLNNTIQRDREHQEQIINERIQAKRFKMQR